MKKNLTYLFSTLFVLTIFCTISTAQEADVKRKITVTIRSINSDGSKNVTIVERTGEDAQKFDVQKYVDEQKKINPDAKVEIYDRTVDKTHNNHTTHNYSYSVDDKPQIITKIRTTQSGENQGFLGVSPFHSEDKVAEGVRVNITRNSGAAKAGLKDDDVILQLNKTPVNSFRDISAFMRATKPSDKVEVVFDRDGATKTATAVLGNQQETWIKTIEQEKEACLGVYTSSQVVAEKRGAVINDFTTISAAQEVKMQIGDLITEVNGVRVKTHQDVWDEIAKYKPNNKVTVTYLRENATKRIEATLKACKPKDEKVIVVPKTPETQKVNPPLNLGKLELESFAASPNPTKDMVNVQFRGQAVPTSVSFYDLTGKVLFQQNITDFNGEYNQRFDLNEYARGIVVVKVQQGDKVFSKQIVVN